MSFCPGIGESACRAVPKRREPRGRIRSTGISAAEKSAVTAACQLLINDFLKPRFLPIIRPTQFNYPVDILGKLQYGNIHPIGDSVEEQHLDARSLTGPRTQDEALQDSVQSRHPR